ncbi:MAG: DMT family transporter [Cyanobacteria bacterium P01_F01_bin.150]
MQSSKTDLANSPLFLVAPFFFLGTAMVAMKYILPHTTPLFLTSFRLLPAGILSLIVAAVLKLPQPKIWAAWLWIGLFSLVDAAMFQGLLTTAHQKNKKTTAKLSHLATTATPSNSQNKQILRRSSMFSRNNRFKASSSLPRKIRLLKPTRLRNLYHILCLPCPPQKLHRPNFSSRAFAVRF